ncbi:MAG: hypothetical protein HFJ52_04040 [Clostridia bacterium]|nr:hypothetical protein [Clostridia bacterium]
MIPFFIFNNINSKDMKVVVNKLPPVSKAERSYEEIEIPGRNGKTYIDNQSYKTFEYSITCTLMPGANIRKISKWLNGSGKLIICTETDKYYDVIIKNQIDFEQIYRVCNEFIVNFEVQPIAHSVREKEIDIFEPTTIIITESTYDIYPLIKIEGSGNITLTINNKSVILKNVNEYIELNCELEEAYKYFSSCNNQVECEEFPKLVSGENHVNWTGNVSSIQIKYEEAFI